MFMDLGFWVLRGEVGVWCLVLVFGLGMGMGMKKVG